LIVDSILDIGDNASGSSLVSFFVKLVFETGVVSFSVGLLLLVLSSSSLSSYGSKTSDSLLRMRTLSGLASLVKSSFISSLMAESINRFSFSVKVLNSLDLPFLKDLLC
jgi:hypothetical protein